MRLAVDGGATTLRMALVEDAEVVGQVEVPGFQWTSGGDPVEQQCQRVVEAWEQLGRPEPVEAIALGLAGGASDRESRERLAPMLRARLSAGRVWLTGDDVTNHLGVLDGEPGVVVAAGTGVACLAVTADGQLLNVDGLGYLFGDLGGGFSLGLAGFRAALAADEGRGPETALLDRAYRVAGLYPEEHDNAEPAMPLPRAVRLWYRSPTLVADIAAFAEDVAGVAEGDAVARELCEQAGRELATSVSAAARRAFGAGETDTTVPVSWSGSVLGSPPIFAAFTAALERSGLPVELRIPRGDSMAGAVRLAQGEDVPHRAGVVAAGVA